ncbi:MAG: hypothetical protein NXH88_18270 [Hyphomonas sp.]|nr:hypothetical protein [Hyphomonas sp.]
MGQVKTIQAELQTPIPLGAILHRPKALDLGAGIQLRRGRVHEVTGAGADMFAVLAAAAHEQSLLWIGLHRDIVTLNPAGLQAHLKIEQMILVEAVSRGELLWAADQALRAPGGFCVILDMPDTLSLKESRRLQLAAEQGGGIGLILLRGPANTTAAQTRWDCQPFCAEQPAWDWTCLKGKNGETGRWRMTRKGPQKRGQNAKDTLHMATAASA